MFSLELTGSNDRIRWYDADNDAVHTGDNHSSISRI